MKHTNQISAKIIADSVNEWGCRITTFILIVPRIVLAEFNTHRMISRNSASSRAIPYKKMLSMVWNQPFVPIKWMKDHKGMQGNEYFEGSIVWLLRNLWLTARTFAICLSWLLSKIGLTKQFCNRLLEPFMWHTILATATEWENFLALRAEKGAEIHIQDCAYKMLKEMNDNTPQYLLPNQWHIPFGDSIDTAKIDRLYREIETPAVHEPWEYKELLGRKIATARCARVSYNNFEGSDNFISDVKLHDSLVKSGHWSPFEHCAKSMNSDEYYSHIHGVIAGAKSVGKNAIQVVFIDDSIFGWSGNFRGYIQYRKTFQGENKEDVRLVKHRTGTALA